METAKVFWSGRSQAVRLPRASASRLAKSGSGEVAAPSSWSQSPSHGSGSMPSQTTSTKILRRRYGSNPRRRSAWARKGVPLMRYLLDANAIIALLNDTTSPIAKRVRRYAPRDFGVSAVVIHELYYGTFKSQRVEQNVARVDALQFSVLEFDEEDARQAGQIRAQLAAKGTPTVRTTS